MPTLLIKNATILVTMDDRRREISGGGLFVRDGFIEKVGLTGELPSVADEVSTFPVISSCRGWSIRTTISTRP